MDFASDKVELKVIRAPAPYPGDEGVRPGWMPGRGSVMTPARFSRRPTVAIAAA